MGLAKDIAHGLHVFLFTTNARKALRCARDLQAGTVRVNCYGEGDIITPFGGYKFFGLSGRDKLLQAFEQYTQRKNIWINLSDHEIDAQLD